VCLKRFPCPWFIQRKPCTFLVPRVTLSRNGPKQAFTWPMSPRSTHACLKRFPCPWYVQRKLCSYLASRLIQSLNGLKQAPTWPTSPRSTIRCAWKDFHAHGMFSAIRTPILRLDEKYLQTDRNELPLDPRQVGVPSGVPKMISKPMVHLAQTMQLYCAETNTISKQIEIRFHLTNVT
jgi:hypothetical protein